MRFVGILIAVLLLAAIYFVVNDSGPTENSDELSPAVQSAEFQDTSAEPSKAIHASDEVDPRTGAQAVSQGDPASTLDLVQQGECELEVQFFDAETYGSVSGRVQLWRIDAPGNQNWTNGDQLQLEEDVLKGVLTVENLAAGTYRVHPLFARSSSPLSPTFKVEGERTREKCHVEMPASQEVNLQIYRPDGSLYSVTGETVDLRKLGWKIHGRESDMRWVENRISTVTGQPKAINVKEANGAKGKKRWSPRPTSDLGIYLGDLLEGDRRSMRTYSYHLRKGSQSSLKVVLPHNGTETDYVAVYIEPKELQASLIFPDGTVPADLSRHFLIETHALPLLAGTDPSSEPVWKRVEVKVHFVAMGYQAYSFSWRPMDGPLPKIYLQLPN